MTLHDAFERVVAISLPYCPERRERLTAHLRENGIADPDKVEWFQAISGDMCPPPAWWNAGNGAWGCFSSHLHLAQRAVMDGVESICILEDDAVFQPQAPAMLARLMREVPQAWGQIYLGGQHYRSDYQPKDVPGSPFVLKCGNVNRTHAFAISKRALPAFQQHIAYAPDYEHRGGWHIDHQLGIAHERGDWAVYCPAWHLAGQEENSSNISGATQPRHWWHPARYAAGLPFFWVDPKLAACERFREGAGRHLHLGWNLLEGTLEDRGLAKCGRDGRALGDWLCMIAVEALDLEKLPALSCDFIKPEHVAGLWRRGCLTITDGREDLGDFLGYPHNGLFPHPWTSPERPGAIHPSLIPPFADPLGRRAA